MPRKKKKIDSVRHIQYSLETDSGPESSFDSKLDPRLKKLKSELDKCRNEKKEYLDGWQRARAESINARKEMSITLNKEFERGVGSAIESFLPVLDSFDSAFALRRDGHSSADIWREGLDVIYSQAESVLANAGVVILNPVGAEFDPRDHEAIGVVHVTEKSDDGVVIETIQRGYKLGTNLIRPARVKIGKFVDN
jgi:molecular chaperone GrpE